MKKDGDEFIDFQVIINNYESLVHELSEELGSVKSEHDILKTKLSHVILENQNLTKQLNKTLTTSGNSAVLDQKELIDNLRQQIQSLLTEKDYMAKLWQNTLKTVEILEGELGVFQAGAQNFLPRKDVSKIKLDYENQIASLQRELNATQKQLDENSKNDIYRGLQNNKYELEISLENRAGALKIVKNLEEEILTLQNRLQESEKTKSKLQRIIKQKEDTLSELIKTNNQYRDKVSEAVQVVEAALNEKDAALFREKGAQEEIQKVSQELSDIRIEAKEKIKKEVSIVKLDYASKYEDLHTELKKYQEQLNIKKLEIEKLSAKCLILETQLEKAQKGNFNTDENYTSKLLVLEKNLESTFQKLLVSEKQNIQLSSEKQSMKNDVDQMSEHYERTLKTKELEKMTFQTKSKQLQINLDETNLALHKIKQQLDIITQEKIDVEKSWKLRLDESEKNLTKSFMDKITDITNQNKNLVGQLQIQIETKDKINKKWSVETKAIIENLEKLVSDLKSELRRVKKENNNLKYELQETKQKFDQYKIFLQVISKDVDKISYMTSTSASPR